MRMLATIALVAAAGSAWAAPAPADTPANKVVRAAIEAAGGETAISKFKGSSSTMKGEISFGENDVEFEGKVIYIMPDKFKLTVNTAVAGMKIELEQVLNGKKVKSVANGMDTPNKSRTLEQLTNNMAEYEALQLVPLLDAKKFTVKVGDDADVDGKKADVLIVNSAVEGSTFKDLKIFFDKSSHLIVKTQRKDKNENDKEVDEENFYSEYKKVQGIQTASKVATKHDGMDYMKFTISDFKYLEKADDKEFSVDD